MTGIRELTAEDYLRAGVGLTTTRRFAAAATCFERAIELDDGAATPHYLLGQALMFAKRYIAAEMELKRAIEIDPSMSYAYHDMGLVRLERGDLHDALIWFDQAMILAPNAADTRLNHALCLLMMGDLDRGFREYEARREFLPADYQSELPSWDGSQVERLHVTAEQGAGDIIQFSRFLPAAARRAKRIIFDVPEDLFDLFASFPEHMAREFDGRLMLRKKGAPTPGADAWVPLCSIPTLMMRPPHCGHDLGFFRRDAGLVDFDVPTCSWSPARVGLCWAGNPVHGHDQERTIALDYFLPLMRSCDFQFYSFQVGQRSNDIALAGAKALLYDLSPKLTSWGMTAAALARMDLIITVDTAVAHLAGAMDIPTWLLVGATPDWRWGITGEKTPWYPSMRLFRQPIVGDWQTTMMLVSDALFS